MNRSRVHQADRSLSIGRTTGEVRHPVKGTVEASGTHVGLLAVGGRYAELFELQAAGYR